MVFRTIAHYPNYLNYSIKRRLLSRSPSSKAKLFAAKARRKRRPRPAWDSTIHDLSVYKLSAAELAAKRALHSSRDYGPSKFGYTKSAHGTSSPSTSSTSDGGSRCSAHGYSGVHSDSGKECQTDSDSEEESDGCVRSSEPETSHDYESSISEQEQEVSGDGESSTELVVVPTEGEDSQVQEGCSAEGGSKSRKDSAVLLISNFGSGVDQGAKKGRRLTRRKQKETEPAEWKAAVCQASPCGSLKPTGKAFPSLADIRASCCTSPTIDFEDEIILFESLQKTTMASRPPSKQVKGASKQRSAKLGPSSAADQRGNGAVRSLQKPASMQLEDNTGLAVRPASTKTKGFIRNPVFRTGLVTYKSSGELSEVQGQRMRGATRTLVTTNSIRRIQLMKPELPQQDLEPPDCKGCSSPAEPHEVGCQAQESIKSAAPYKSPIQVTSPDGDQVEINHKGGDSLSPETSPNEALHQELERLRQHHHVLIKEFEDFKRCTKQEIESLQVELRNMLADQQNSKSSTPKSTWHGISVTSTGQSEQLKDMVQLPSPSLSGLATMAPTSGLDSEGRDEASPPIHQQYCVGEGGAGLGDKSSETVRMGQQCVGSQDCMPQDGQENGGDPTQPREIPDFLKQRFHPPAQSPSSKELSLPHVGDISGIVSQLTAGVNEQGGMKMSDINPLYSPVRDCDGNLDFYCTSNVGQFQLSDSGERCSFNECPPHHRATLLNSASRHSLGVDKFVRSFSKRVAAHEAEFQLGGSNSYLGDAILLHQKGAIPPEKFSNPFENPLFEGGVSRHLLDRKLSGLSQQAGAGSLDKGAEVMDGCKEDAQTTYSSLTQARQGSVRMQCVSSTQNRVTSRQLEQSNSTEGARTGAAQARAQILCKHRPSGSAASFENSSNAGMLKFQSTTSTCLQEVEKENINYFGKKTFRGAQTWTAARASIQRS